jgi:hypothetical protein
VIQGRAIIRKAGHSQFLFLLFRSNGLLPGELSVFLSGLSVHPNSGWNGSFITHIELVDSGSILIYNQKDIKPMKACLRAVVWRGFSKSRAG